MRSESAVKADAEAAQRLHPVTRSGGPATSSTTDQTEESPIPPDSPRLASHDIDRDASETQRWFLLRPVIVYLLCRTLTLAGLAIANAVTHRGIRDELFIFDAHWFVRATEQGWPSHLPTAHGHVTSSTVAFFPLFPLTIRWMATLTGLSPMTVGVAISGMTGMTSIIAIGTLVRHFAGSQKAERGALLMAVFPGTFVFSIVYPEGIVITCVAFGLLALLRRQWLLAGILGLLASATSPIALAFFVSCAWCSAQELRRDRNWRSLVAPFLAPLGFAGYMGWLWVHTGVLSAWRLTEREGWGSYPSLGYPLHMVRTFVLDPIVPTATGQMLLGGTVVAVIGTVFAIRERQPVPVLLYGLTAAAMAWVAVPVGLRPRFLLLAFPLIVAIGTRLRGRAYAWTVAGSACVLVCVTVMTLSTSAVFP